MKRTFLIPLLGVVASAVLAVEGAPPEPVTPPIEVPVIAPVPEHGHFRAVYRVSNPYDKPFRVTDVGVSCSCLSYRLSERVIPVGGSIAFEAEADPDGRSGVNDFDYLLLSDREDQAPLRIPVQFTVVGDVTVDWIPEPVPQGLIGRPADADYRDWTRYSVSLRQARKRPPSFVIRVGSDAPPAGGLQVLDVQVPLPWQVDRTQQEDGSWILRLRLADGQRVPEPAGGGYDQRPITVLTNHPKKPTVTLLVTTMDLGANR